MRQTIPWTSTAFAALLSCALVGQASAQNPKDADVVPGAKRLCTIPVGYGLDTTLFYAAGGLRVVDVVNAVDPQNFVKNPGGGFKPPKLTMWDAETGKELALPANGVTLNDYKYKAVSPDESKLLQMSFAVDPGKPSGITPKAGPGVTIPYSYKIALQDLKSNKGLHWFDMKTWDRPVVRFAPDSSFVVVAGDSEFFVLQPGADKKTLTCKIARKLVKTPYATRPGYLGVDMQLTADSKYLAVGVDGVVRVYDLAKGTVVFETPANPKAPVLPGGAIQTLAFALPNSQQSTKLLVAYGTGDFKLFDYQAKKQLWHNPGKAQQPGSGFGGLSAINAQLFFNAQDEPRAFVSEPTYQPKTKNWLYKNRFIDPATGKTIQQFQSQGYHKYFMAADGQHLVRTSYEKERYTGKQTVEVWSLDSAGK